MPFDAFISYSSKNQTAADATVAALEAEKIRCWIAHRDISAGKPWAEAIFEGIDRCRVMVLVFSSYANSSIQVAREIARAASKEMPIIPIRIEGVEPVGALGYYLSGLHWLDTIDPPQQEKLKQLAGTIESILRSAAYRDAPEAETPQPKRGIPSADRNWDAGASLMWAVQAHPGHVWSVGFSPDEQHIVSVFTLKDLKGSASRTEIAMRRIDDGRRLWSLERDYSVLPSRHLIGFSHDGELLTVAGWLLKANNGEDDSPGIYACAISPDKRRIAYDHGHYAELRDRSGNDASRLHVSRLPRVRALSELYDPHALVFSPDGKWLCGTSIYASSPAVLWRGDTGEMVRKFGGEQVAFSGNSARFVCFGDNGFGVVKTETGEILCAQEAGLLQAIGKNEVWSAALSAGGARLVLGRRSGRVDLVESDTGKLIRTLGEFPGGATALAFSQDGRLLVGGSAGGMMRLWCTTASAGT